jgi:membrane fusion protein, multidrug efflux system
MARRTFALITRFAIPLAIMGSLVLWLSGSFRAGGIQPDVRPASRPNTARVDAPLITVEATHAPDVIEAVGSVQPQFKTTVSARLVANVIELPVVAGQRVRRGEVLVRLDDRDLRAKVEQAQQAFRRAEATRELAQRDYDRDATLFEQLVISRAEFDRTALHLKTSMADGAALEQASQDAHITLGHAVIRSGYDGVIIDKLADVGDVATPGKPLLTMYERGRLWLEAEVPEGQAGNMRIGQTYETRLDSRAGSMTGVLDQIVPSANPSSRTITVRVALPAAAQVFPGLFGRLLIPVGERERIFLPQSAVLHVGQLTMVDVEQAGTLQRRSVQLGAAVGSQVEILSGLINGERVSRVPRTELDR